MGGLVIKKAYNLARQVAAYESLAHRVHSIVFLATPHRGSDSAKLLGNILWFASSSKEYVNELREHSGTIQTISDEFRNYERDLDLWSFYVTSPLKIGKIASQLIVEPDSAVMGCYNEKQMSYHIAHSDPRSDELLALLDKFLKLNVLSWIEIIAQTQDLIFFIRVAKHLRSYLKACSIERSPLSREVSLLRGWTTDLIRITAKFADALVLSPSAIYSLILPFCPTSSSVYKTSNNGRRLAILGLSHSQWDDRVSCIDFVHGRTSAVGVGDHFLGVGLTTGTVIV
ncbi:hypothetical protein ONS96_006035 [Cadophora gregata f. sp. sojae]|nr:hypothetical protein ONS96_006035 [Cadophora gregata f. sp. sojae]